MGLSRSAPTPPKRGVFFQTWESHYSHPNHLRMFGFHPTPCRDRSLSPYRSRDFATLQCHARTTMRHSAEDLVGVAIELLLDSHRFEANLELDFLIASKSSRLGIPLSSHKLMSDCIQRYARPLRRPIGLGSFPAASIRLIVFVETTRLVASSTSAIVLIDSELIDMCLFLSVRTHVYLSNLKPHVQSRHFFCPYCPVF